MNRIIKYLPFIVIALIILLSFSAAHAQCAMCQAVAESSRDAGSSAAEGINKGVLYIMVMPYLLIGTIAYFWWKAKKKAQQS